MMTPWESKGREFGNCNCNYSCPCQFNAMPDNGHCRGLAVYDIEEGYHGTTRLDGLRAAGVFRWPGPIHEGKGEGLHIVDARATPAQREALLRILRGEDTDPFATVFNVFSSTCDTLREPVVAEINFEMDIDGRTAHAAIEGVLEMRGAPILNPVTGAGIVSASCNPMASNLPRRRSGAAGPRRKGRSLTSSRTVTASSLRSISASTA
jgi:hypothetical protein